MELNEDALPAAPAAPKVLAPLKVPSPKSPLLNGHSSMDEDLPPEYESLAMEPLVRGVPERESTTSRDYLLAPDL